MYSHALRSGFARRRHYLITVSYTHLYLGRFEKLPEDGKACQSAEIYQQEVLAKDENGYQGLALLMDTVEVTGVKGVFVNKEAIENFFSRLEK